MDLMGCALAWIGEGGSQKFDCLAYPMFAKYAGTYDKEEEEEDFGSCSCWLGLIIRANL